MVVGHDIAVGIDDHARSPGHVRTGRAAKRGPRFRLLLFTGRPAKGARSKRSGRRDPERARARTTGRAFMISPPRVTGPSDPLALRDLDVHDRRGDGLHDGRKALGQLGWHSGSRAVGQRRRGKHQHRHHRSCQPAAHQKIELRLHMVDPRINANGWWTPEPPNDTATYRPFATVSLLSAQGYGSDHKARGPARPAADRAPLTGDRFQICPP